MTRSNVFWAGVCISVVLSGVTAPEPASATTPFASTASGIRAAQAAAGSFGALLNAPIASAQLRAQSTGEPVVVEELNTPTEQVSALPDGTMQLEASTLPVRVERDDAWVAVDTTLVRAADWFEPADSAAPVRFSPGGSDQLAQVQTESGEWISERWPYGNLPVPTVDGDTATYAEVLPGVDLKMVATLTGQTSIYVIKDKKAAASSKLDELHVVIEGAELKPTSGGAVEAEASDGSQLVAGNPLWWDSSSGGTYRAPGGFAPSMPVEHEVGMDRVALDVGESINAQEARSGRDVKYPIFIDPDWSPGLSASWYTDKAFPGVSYPSTNPLRVGVSAPYHSDMFFQFPLSRLIGTVPSAAVLTTTMTSVLWCSPDAIGVSTFGLTPGINFTWNQEIGIARSSVLQWQNPGNCGSPPMLVAWNVLSGVTPNIGSPSIRLGITSSLARSRRHFLPSATLTVTYNTPPSTPTAPAFTSPSRTCGTAAAPAVLGQTSVAVSVDQRDPDGGNVGTNFHLAKASDLTTNVQLLGSGLAAGGTKTVTFTGLVNGEAYAWRGRGQDVALHSGGFSNWCYFTVDTTKPAVPTATVSPTTSFVVGQGVDISASGGSDVAGYVYWVAPGQLVSPAPSVPVGGAVSLAAALPPCDGVVGVNVRWACGSGTTPKTIRVAPVDGLSTLWVSAYDKAGNQSAAKGVPLYPGGNINTPAQSANIDAGHAWQVTSMDSPLPLSLPDSNPWIGANALSLHLPSNWWADATDLIDPPASYPVIRGATTSDPSESIRTTAAPVNAKNSFTLSVWLRPQSLPMNTDQYVAIQGGAGRGSVDLRITPSGKYSFCIVGAAAADDNGRPVSGCATGGAVSLTQWQLVTGIWDASNQQLRLLVGNSITPVAVAGHVVGSGDWSANGPLEFAPPPDSFRYYGLLANPVMVPGVLDRRQLARLAAFELPFTD